MQQHAAHVQQGHSRLNGAALQVPRPQFYTTSRGTLQWHPEYGVGYFPVIDPHYDQAYFDRFARQALDPIGKTLMENRVEFVERHYPKGILLDVGIGCGAFVELRNKWNGAATTFGYDINPAGIKWLKERRLWFDPYTASPFPALSLWDVLEHIKDFRPLLAKCMGWLFLSLPIFRDVEHILTSKHFRPDEHVWYFSRDGLVNVMQTLGFDLAAESDMETAAGREDIGAFAFRRN